MLLPCESLLNFKLLPRVHIGLNFYVTLAEESFALMLVLIVSKNFAQKRIYGHPLKKFRKNKQTNKKGKEKKRKDTKEPKTNPKYNKPLEYLCYSLLLPACLALIRFILECVLQPEYKDKPWRSIHTVFNRLPLWWLQFDPPVFIGLDLIALAVSPPRQTTCHQQSSLEG